MSIFTSDGPVKVFLEQPDGTVHELTGAMKEFEINQEIEVSQPRYLGDTLVGGNHTITATFTIVGDAYKIFKPKEFGKEVQNRNLANEWMCDWCGSPNIWTDRHCDSCGGARSFIYD